MTPAEAREQLEPVFRRRNLRPHELMDIVQRMKRLTNEGLSISKAAIEVGKVYGRHPDTIRMVIDRFRPTTTVAQDYLRANSLRLAMRVVRKATVAEAIQVLERQNIGVLAPLKAQGESAPSFIMSVTAESCGVVKVGVQQNGGQHAIAAGNEVSTDPIWGEVGVQQERQGGRGEEHEDGRYLDPADQESAISGEGYAAQDPETAGDGQNVTVTPPESVTVTRKRGFGHGQAYQEALEKANERLSIARMNRENREVAEKTRLIKRQIKLESKRNSQKK